MHVVHRFLTRACVVATAGIALGTWGVTAAGASAGGRVPVHHGAGIVTGRGGALQLTRNGPSIGLSANAPVRNRYLAGYQAAVKAGSATVVAASYTLPTLTCTTTTRAISPDAGVAVANNKASVALVVIGCVNGKPVYLPQLILNGKLFPSSVSFAAGDVINLTTKVSTTRTKVEVTDVNTGVVVKRRGVGASTRAAWTGDAPATDGRTGALLHVPDFGKITFKNCLVDGTALGSLNPRKFERVNSNGTVQISTGGFFPGGTAFTTHFMHT